jgi:hypothetical protein
MRGQAFEQVELERLGQGWSSHVLAKTGATMGLTELSTQVQVTFTQTGANRDTDPQNGAHALVKPTVPLRHGCVYSSAAQKP